MDTRTIFLGSPPFALPTLRMLARETNLVGVVTQPDRPAGRGKKVQSPAVKEEAEGLAIPIIQPQRVSTPEVVSQLRAWSPDLLVVAAFGQILRPEVLDLAPYGSLNVHASLLPRWRGAAPIQAAILHGDDETGVTIMIMDPGVDTGPILSQEAIPIPPEATAGSLSPQLAQLGADLLEKTLPLYLDGTIQPTPQDDSLATRAPMLKKADGELDFSLPAELLARKIRAYNPWPGTYTTWRGASFKILAAHASATSGDPHLPGRKLVFEGCPAIQSGAGLLILDLVQPSGKKPLEGEAFLRGAVDWEQADV